MGTNHRRLSRQASVRLQAGDLILRGFDNVEIMDILEVSLASVQRWHKKIETEGLHALARHAGTGREPKLSPEQFEELKTLLTQGANVNTPRITPLLYPCWHL